MRSLRLLAAAALAWPNAAPAQPRRPLTPADVDDVARLVMMEDRRELDSATVARLLAAPHPELRRRAALSIGRIVDRRGLALLRARPLDADSAVAAWTVFAVGQFRDSTTVTWLDSLLTSPRTAPTVATEAAAALGKIRTGTARAALARYLTTATASARATPTIGEALLAIGRATPRGDLAPIVRWTRSPDEELRWRATWALFRPRDPAALPTLLALGSDPSAHVRSWAVRGLTKAQADSASIGAQAEARLLVAARDADRRVRTEAIRALGTYTDSAAVAVLLGAVASRDAWLSVSAAEGLGRVRTAAVVPALLAAAGPGRSCALRITAMQMLQPFVPRAAIDVAVDLARDSVPYCRTAALQTLARAAAGASATAPLGASASAVVARLVDDSVASIRLLARQVVWAARDAELAPVARRAMRRAELPNADVATRVAALRAMSSWADSTDLAWLLVQFDAARVDTAPTVASAAASAIAAIQRRQGVGAATFFARFAPPDDATLRRDIDRAFDAAARSTWPAAPRPARPLAEYRAIVERWIVPEYTGTARPRVRWETPRGPIDLELYAGDAPLATDDFMRTMQSGAIVGTDFIRVVPDFVDQQRPIIEGNVLRDEVNRHRLTRGNLAWATAGLDTGSPGYTLGHTPQPHNEGDFTSLGRVVRGMDAVDRIELGDRILGARMLPR
jgi:HEAT repeat protein/cyclophilin family peptidyl-prolyl cis-trans isomerase